MKPSRRALLRFGALAFAAPRSVVVPPLCCTHGVPFSGIYNECDECWLDAPLTSEELAAFYAAEELVPFDAEKLMAGE